MTTSLGSLALSDAERRRFMASALSRIDVTLDRLVATRAVVQRLAPSSERTALLLKIAARLRSTATLRREQAALLDRAIAARGPMVPADRSDLAVYLQAFSVARLKTPCPEGIVQMLGRVTRAAEQYRDVLQSDVEIRPGAHLWVLRQKKMVASARRAITANRSRRASRQRTTCSRTLRSRVTAAITAPPHWLSEKSRTWNQ